MKTQINIPFFVKRKYNYRDSISYVLQKYDQINNIIYEINFEIIFVWSLGKNSWSHDWWPAVISSPGSKFIVLEEWKMWYVLFSCYSIVYITRTIREEGNCPSYGNIWGFQVFAKYTFYSRTSWVNTLQSSYILAYGGFWQIMT